MKLTKNNDTISLIVVVLVVLITIVFKDTFMLFDTNPKTDSTYNFEYTDVDTQIPHILRWRDGGRRKVV